jgi:hypothetical protein
MPRKIVDFGPLTTEQTKEVAMEALSHLTIEEIADVIKEAMEAEDFAAVLAILNS